MKLLLENLKRVLLDTKKNCPTTISYGLQEKEEDELMHVLKKYKSVMEWTIGDLKGINPTVCMNKIQMEDDHKPVVQP